MASALLASQNEPYWGERKVYMRKYTNNPTSENPLFKLNRNPNPRPAPYFNANHVRHVHANDTPSNGRFRQSDESPPVVVSGDSTYMNQKSVLLCEPKESSRDGYVTFNVGACTRKELKDLKKRLIAELEQVRILRSRLESGEFESRPIYPTSRFPAAQPQPSGQLTYISETPDANGERTLNANQCHPASGSLSKKKGPNGKRSNPYSSSKDPNSKRLFVDPAMEKLVTSGMKKCGQILTKLMKHRHSWVFNTPVDVVGLGLHDYYQIIKTPMDLGTVKSNLGKNLYKSPLDFASDVRLTFNNALSYNPKGSDVSVMAEILSAQFEEMFSPALKKFENEHRRLSTTGNESSPLQRAWPQNLAQEAVRKGPEPISIAKKSEIVRTQAALPTPAPVQMPAAPQTVAVPPPQEPPSVVIPRSGKLPKPKAKDPNKRQMSYEEKAKLGMSLQDLPPEKMTQLVHILRKRNRHLAQDGDEIELDIEALDNETLWELDRFVSNYKKMVSKMKRQELIHSQIPAAQISKSAESDMEEAEEEEKSKKVEAGEEDVDIGEDIPMGNFPPVEIEKDDATVDATSSRSGSSGSSSNSSSSSGSDSGSSSGSDSEADSAQSPFVEVKENPET